MKNLLDHYQNGRFIEAEILAKSITKELTDKYNAVELVKVASEIIGGKGGGGRKDFAQAGGQFKDKIDEAFEKIKTLI